MWYYQLDPNDGFDYDLAAAPLLFNDRAGRRRVAVGSKNGFVYLIDRESHRLVWKTAVITIKHAAGEPVANGVYTCPGEFGGVQWNGPTYSPTTDQVYVGSVDRCATFSSGSQRYEPPPVYLGTAASFKSDDAHSGWVYELTASGGEPVWQYHADSPVLSGATPTAGGTLFRNQNLGVSMGGGVITYLVSGTE